MLGKMTRCTLHVMISNTMKLMPKQDIFFEFFLGAGKDLRELSALFLKFADSFDDHKGYAERAHTIERDADEKTHRVIEELNTSFITPFDREDVYMLAHELDDIIDLLEDVILHIHMYRVKKKISALPQFAAIISEGANDLYEMLTILSHMKNTPDLKEAKIKIHHIEDRGDILFEEAVTKLFSEETDAIELVKVKDVLEKVEMVVDKMQEVSDLIEGIIIKST